MIANANVSAVLAVVDLDRARKFYEGTLGLEVVKANPYEIYYKSGNTFISTYVSGYAGTNKATTATWEVDSVEDEVQVLESGGIVFEQYDMEGTTREGGVHSMGDTKAAWFKDPDGNILCLHHEG